MSNRSIFLWCFVFLVVVAPGDIVSCQERSITSLIKEIESNSSFIVNYDKALTDIQSLDFSFEGNYSVENIEKFFKRSLFEIVIDDQSIVLLPFDENVKVLYGRVLSEDGNPLPFASLLIDSVQGMETGADGSFALKYKGGLEGTCVISYIGYRDTSVTVRSLTDGGKIFLEKDNILFPESIIIKSYIKKSISEGRSFGSLDIDMSTDQNGFVANDQDVFRSLQNLPGISSPDDGATNLNIRGGTADHNNITWEGVPLYDRGYLSGMISSVNPYNIDDIQVYKSNTSAEKNSRIGGTIDMQLSDDILDKTILSSGINLTEGHINIGTPLIQNQLGLYIAGRKSLFSEFYSSPTLSSYAQKVFQTEVSEVESESESSEEIEPKISFHDLNAKLIYKVDDRLMVKSALLSSKGNNENLSILKSIDLNGRDIFKTSSNALMNSLHYVLNEANRIEFIHTLSKFDSENELLYSNDSSTTTIEKEEIFNSIHENQFKLKWQYNGTWWTSSMGYIHDRKLTKVEMEKESTIGPEIEEEVEVEGIFHHLFIDQQLANEKRILDYGVRATYSSSLSRFFVSPSLSYRYRLNSNVILKSSAGIYHQFIRQVYNTIDDDLNDDNTIWTLNTAKDEPVLRAHKFSAGSSWRNASWLIDVEAYIHRTSGLAAENPIIRNSVTLNSKNQLFSKGIDLIVTKKISNWSTSVFYNLSKNSITLPEVYEGENESFFANNNQTHKLRINGSYQLKSLVFGISYNYKTGLPYSSQPQLKPSEDDEEKYELQYENINNQTLSDYHRLDFSARYEGSWRSIKYQLGCSVLNLSDRTNVGSRKSILTNTGSTTAEPTVVEIRKKLLPRTFIFYSRVFFLSC